MIYGIILKNMTQNLFITSLKFVLIDLIGDILYWPIWWFTKGTLKMGIFCINQIRSQEQILGLSVWVKNLFTPMFGQYDIEGRIISFFARLLQIIFRSIVFLIWIILTIILFLAWIVFPIFIVYQVVINLLYLIS